jgi:glycosyltransferase involved in cell wall biosynthesis
MANPELSVIMTVYNGQDFLHQALEGIFSQSFKDFELIVVNNGSTDDTQVILEACTDPRLKIVQQTLYKPTFGDGIRLAFSHAVGEYVAVNDADDISMPDRFLHQVSAFEANENLGLVSGFYEEIDENGAHLQDSMAPTDIKELLEAYQSSNPLAHSTYMMRRSAAKAVGGYASDYNYGTDFALALRLIKAGWEIEVLPEKVLQLRLHSNQASIVSDLSVMRAYEAVKLFKEAASLPGLSARARKIGRRNLAKRTLQYAFALFSEGTWFKGLGQVVRSLGYHPIYALIYLFFRIACKLKLIKHPVY